MKRLCLFAQKHTGTICIILLVLLVISVIMSISIGTASISFLDVWRIILNKIFGNTDISHISSGTQNIVLYLRIPRAILEMLIGAALTLSGVGMQAFTKNPLSEPYVLGISSGASTGAVLAIICGVYLPWGSKLSIPIGAFCGAIISIIAVYSLAYTNGEISPIRLILVGVAVSAIFSAITNFIVYTAPQEAQVREATFWMLGGLGNAEWSSIIIPAIVLVPAFIVMLILARPLNALMMGDDTAITLGVNINGVRKILIFLTAILTSCSVAASGCIGFIGLIVPHIVRSIIGSDHIKLIPVATICGSLFLIWADVAARIVCAPAEMPVGILTAIIGGPLFLWMVRKRKYSFGK